MRGENCRYGHPTVCQNARNFGLCKVRGCDLIHKQVCRSFWIKGFCTRSNCCFIHPAIIEQRVQTENGHRNVRNRGHNRDRRDYQQNQKHTSYVYRNNRNNIHNYQNYQDNLSQGTHSINTVFLRQKPVMNIEWRMEELIRRMERLEGELMNRWSRKQ